MTFLFIFFWKLRNWIQNITMLIYPNYIDIWAFVVYMVECFCVVYSEIQFLEYIFTWDVWSGSIIAWVLGIIKFSTSLSLQSSFWFDWSCPHDGILNSGSYFLKLPKNYCEKKKKSVIKLQLLLEVIKRTKWDTFLVHNKMLTICSWLNTLVWKIESM